MYRQSPTQASCMRRRAGELLWHCRSDNCAMKIAFVFPPMWTPHSDGSLQIWNREVTTRLAKCCDVLVYSALFSFLPDDRVDGVRYRRFDTHWDSRLLKYLRIVRRALAIRGATFGSDLWWPGYALRVALDLRHQDCDVIHCYYYPQFARLIKYFNPATPVVLHMHGEWLTQVKFTNLRSRLAKIDSIISCSEYCTKSICTMFPEVASRCRTVAMGMSPKKLAPTHERLQRVDLPSRRLLYVGRISPEKGVHVLIDAFEIISRQYPDASLTIVGAEWVAPREDITDLSLKSDAIASLIPYYEGSYLAHLKRKLSVDAAKRVTFTGLVAHQDVPLFYGQADVYINPSYYESFGVSIVEAMAAGVPVVAANGGAVPDLVLDGQTGLLVEAGNPSAMADAVMRLFRDVELRRSISSVAREMVAERYSWEAICSSLMTSYRDALGVPDHQEERWPGPMCLSSRDLATLSVGEIEGNSSRSPERQDQCHARRRDA